jgi:hypothetical protein
MFTLVKIGFFSFKSRSSDLVYFWNCLKSKLKGNLILAIECDRFLTG